MASNAPTQREQIVLEPADAAPAADIRGAFGTIHGDDAHRGLRSRLLALLAIIGPGLIVMVGETTPAASRPTRRRARTTGPPCFGCCLRWFRS